MTNEQAIQILQILESCEDLSLIKCKIQDEDCITVGIPKKDEEDNLKILPILIIPNESFWDKLEFIDPVNDTNNSSP